MLQRGNPCRHGLPHLRTIDGKQRRLVDRGHRVGDGFIDAGVQEHLGRETAAVKW